MDARERLRRYLEQRRELGESELVLDGLAVEDVMAMLGARAIAKRPRGASGPSAMVPPIARPRTSASVEFVDPPIATPLPESRINANASGDWREALRPVAPSTSDAGDAAAPTGDAAPTRRASLPDWLIALRIPAGVSAPHTAPETSPDTATVLGDEHSKAVRNTMHLDDLAELVRQCTRCALHVSARRAVPGEGDPRAELVCVGEAPGANEDEQGRPFVGDAGQLLTKILAAIQLSRESVYICNVLKHRPPANRDPLPDEVSACQPFLQRQLELVMPRVILALGRFAAQTLLGTSTPLGKLRGSVHMYRGIPVIVTYHPAALLRNEAWKRPTWDDVKLARTILDASRAATGSDGDRSAPTPQ